MSIILQGSTSGSVTLQEPAVAGTTVLDLPATSGTLDRTNRAGNVLQVVSYADSNQRSTANSAFTASGMLVTITPTSATSKIFVKLDTCAFRNGAGSGYLSIFRNGTNLAGTGNQLNMFSIGDAYVPLSISFLDSPASTSALTYEVYYARSSSGNIYINSTNSGSTVGSITVTEIAG